MNKNKIQWKVDVELLFAPTRTESIVVEAKTRKRAEKMALKLAKKFFDAPLYRVASSQGLV